MKKTWMCTAVLCLLMTACGAQARQQMDAEPNAADQPPASSQETPEADAWRDDYKQFLSELCRQEAEQRSPDNPDYDPNVLMDQSLGYFLYDMNSDGVPELFLEFTARTEVYTFRNGETARWGELNTWHSSLYTDPEGNGVISEWGFSGGQSIERVSLEEDGTVQTQSLYEKTDLNADYKQIYEVVPGSLCLRSAQTVLGRTFGSKDTADAGRPLTLPVDDYGTERVRLPEERTASADAKAAIERVLEQGETFYGVSADGFGGDTGETTWEAYLAPGGVDKYTSVPQKVERMAWADVNGDGILECVVTLLDMESWPHWPDQAVIFSWQEGRVYAYCLDYAGKDNLDQNGVFWWGDDARDSACSFAVSFRKEQCYCYTALHDPAVPSVDWIAS